MQFSSVIWAKKKRLSYTRTIVVRISILTRTTVVPIRILIRTTGILLLFMLKSIYLKKCLNYLKQKKKMHYRHRQSVKNRWLITAQLIEIKNMILCICITLLTFSVIIVSKIKPWFNWYSFHSLIITMATIHTAGRLGLLNVIRVINRLSIGLTMRLWKRFQGYCPSRKSNFSAF